jgi:hypothetical protein
MPFGRGNKREPALSNPMLSARQCNIEASSPDKQAITTAQLYEPPRHKPALYVETILVVDLAATRA